MQPELEEKLTNLWESFLNELYRLGCKTVLGDHTLHAVDSDDNYLELADNPGAIHPLTGFDHNLLEKYINKNN
jgi:hypothetical protein